MSASDRSFVARMAEKGVVQTTATPRSPATAKTTVELAKILRFSRQAVNQWKLLEGAPRPMSNGKHSVKAWCEGHRVMGGDGFWFRSVGESRSPQGARHLCRFNVRSSIASRKVGHGGLANVEAA